MTGPGCIMNTGPPLKNSVAADITIISPGLENVSYITIT